MGTPGSGPSEQLPLFPLGTVLAPGMPLSLHIFEPRYRQLIADLLNEQNPQAPEFGVVALRAGWEVGTLQDVYPVGTTARVTDVLPLPDGRCDLSAVGERRFLIDELDTTSRPYLMATVRRLAELDGRLSVALVASTQRAMLRHRQALARLNVDYAESPGADGRGEAGPTETGPAKTGSDEPGLAETGPDETGPDETGPDETGPDETGPTKTGSDEIGPTETGLGEAGLAEGDSSGLKAPADSVGPVGDQPAGVDPIAARKLSYAVACQSWLPLADRQQLLASPDTAARLRDARAVLRREAELVSQLRAVPVSAAAFRN